MRVEIVDRPAELAGLGDAWRDLFNRSGASVFQSYEWAWTWWMHFGARAQLRVAVAWEGARAVGIAPFAVTRWEGFRHLGLLGSGTADYEDILLDSGEGAPRILPALLSQVLHHAGWDVLQSKRLREDATLLRHGLPVLRADPHLRVEVREFGVAPFVSLNCDWTAYWETRRKSMRKDTERQERRLAREIGEIACRRPSSREDVSAMMDVLERLHRARWSEERGDRSFFENPKLRAFYRDVTAVLYDAGRLDLEMMLAGERVASAHLGVTAGTRYGYLVPTHDPALGRYSPGRLHLIRLLRRCFESGMTEFDMLFGDESYKSEFASGYRTINSLRVAPATLRGRLAFWWFGAARDRLRASRARRLIPALRRLRNLRG